MSNERQSQTIIGIKKNRLIPIATVNNTDEGLRICDALLEGGLDVVEVTFRTKAAGEAIKAISNRFPSMLVGAGTILNLEDLDRAIDSGAKFAVAPGCNPRIVSAAIGKGIPFFPGVATATDIELAYEIGARCLKMFPAEPLGGVKMLKAWLGPYGHLDLSFVPTGGINDKNMGAYLELAKVAAIGGSWMVEKNMVKDAQWDKITEITAKTLEIIKSTAIKA